MKTSDSSSFEQDTLTWNVIAPGNIFKQALFEEAEVSGRISWCIRELLPLVRILKCCVQKGNQVRQ